MNDTTPTKDQTADGSSPWFGVVLIGTATVFLVLATRIERLSFTDEHDPGPTAFPIVLSIILLLGGVYQLVSGWFSPPASVRNEELGDYRSVALFAVNLSLFVALVPWVGFSIPAFLFVAIMTWHWGARWWAALATALLLLLIVWGLFQGLFEVQLPSGSLR